MRYALLFAAALTVAGCSKDSKPKAAQPSVHDAGWQDAAANQASSDAGASSPPSSLPHPETDLLHPPTDGHLPPDLRPPSNR
ncbi:MAG TPA: hypothetical protein VGI70_04635 [Polyangiales bacterium]|jgi:hypothetical protein